MILDLGLLFWATLYGFGLKFSACLGKLMQEEALTLFTLFDACRNFSAYVHISLPESGEYL